MAPKRAGNPPAKTQKTQSLHKINHGLLRFVSIAFLGTGAAILLSVYGQTLSEEVRYQAGRSGILPAAPAKTQPTDYEFGILIPKIGANARVVADVDPWDSRQYQPALTRGIAHAAGSAKPGQTGNVFLFSHSSATLADALRYNSVFYLLGKLEPGDEMTVYYQHTPYVYAVTGKKTVLPSEISYLYGTGGKETLTLMTCWPPGTDWKRLLVIAERTVDMPNE